MIEKIEEKIAEKNVQLKVLLSEWKEFLRIVYYKYFLCWSDSAFDVANVKGEEIRKLVLKIQKSHESSNIVESTKGFVKSLKCSTLPGKKTDFEQLVSLWHDLMQHLKENEFFREYA